MKIQLFPLLLLVPMTGQAAVYQCQVDGRTVFTDHPCRGPGHEVVLEVDVSSDDASVDYGAVNAGIRDRVAARSDKRKISKLDSKIRKANKKIDSYRAEMDRELSVWRAPC